MKFDLVGMAERSIKNPLFRRMAVYALSDGLSKAIPFIVLPIIANYLTTAEFGLVTNYSIFVQLFAAIIGFSTHTSLNVNYYKSKAKKALISNLVATNMLLFLLSIMFILIAHDYVEDKTEITYNWQILAMVNAFGNWMFMVFTTKLRLEEKSVLFGKLQFSQSFLSATLSILFVIVLSWSWKGRLFSLLLTSVTVGLISIVYLLKGSNFTSHVKPKAIGDHFKYALPLVPHTMANWLRNGLEKFLITDQLGNSLNGVFSMGTTLMAVFTMFNAAFFSAYSPYLYKRLSEADLDEAKKEEVKIDLLRKSYLYIIIWSLFLLIGYFAMKLLIIYALRAEYQETLEYLPHLTVALFFGGFYNVFFGFIFYYKKNLLVGTITIASSIVHVLLSYFLLKEVGLMGVAYSKIVVQVLIAAAITYVGHRLYPMPWFDFKKIIRV